MEFTINLLKFSSTIGGPGRLPVYDVLFIVPSSFCGELPGWPGRIRRGMILSNLIHNRLLNNRLLIEESIGNECSCTRREPTYDQG